MRALSLAAPGTPLRVLCLGAHCDDVEIGAGGTLLRLLAEHPGSIVRWLVLTSTAERAVEARASAEAFTADADVCDLTVLELRDGYLPEQWGQAKDAIEKLAAEGRPDVVLTHHRGDAHQDHRTVAELTWTVFRDHLVLEYEIPKFDGDLDRPNAFVGLDADTVERKCALLDEHYPSQRARSWFDPAVFTGLARIRGVEAGGEVRYAEAFHVRKVVW